MTTTVTMDLVERVRAVPAPTPVLSRADAEALTSRQQEVLDQLSEVFEDGFVHLTMADIAATVNCSLRTLYSLASSRDELVLIVVDRNLWRLGRGARRAITADAEPLDALRAYLRAANVAVAGTTSAFARDAISTPSTRALNESHNAYIIAVAHELLDAAVERGQIDGCNTAAVARVIAGLGHDFSRPDVLTTLGASPKEAADEVLDVILRGLARSTQPSFPTLRPSQLQPRQPTPRGSTS